MSKLARVSNDVSHLEGTDERIVNKRRSSIFNSRTVTFQKNDDIDSVHRESRGDKHEIYSVRKTVTPIAISVCGVESFDLRQYVDHLISETKAWRKLYSDRKAERRCVTKERRIIESTGQQNNLSALSGAELKFLTSQPKYKDIEMNYNILSNSAIEVSTLCQLVLKLNGNYVRRMEEDLYRVVKRIVRLSETVP